MSRKVVRAMRTRVCLNGKYQCSRCRFWLAEDAYRWKKTPQGRDRLSTLCRACERIPTPKTEKTFAEPAPMPGYAERWATERRHEAMDGVKVRMPSEYDAGRAAVFQAGAA